MKKKKNQNLEHNQVIVIITDLLTAYTIKHILKNFGQ